MIRERIIEIFDTMGLQITEYKDTDLLKEYIHDSLALISFMVFLEEKFSIEIDDKYFNKDFYETTFEEIEQMIIEITTKTGE